MVFGRPVIAAFSKMVVHNKTSRGLARKHFEKVIYDNIMKDATAHTKNIKLFRYAGALAMMEGFIKNYEKGHISKKAMDRLIETLLDGAMLGSGRRKQAIKEFRQKHGIDPPLFITIAPGKLCNLKCVGCYASASHETCEALAWDVVEKLFEELHDKLGMRFFVITGGEPLAYRSQGKTILDLPRKYKDSYFLMYTNGTLISEEIAKEMAELGNITPGISLEGYEKETDERRGKGVYAKVQQAIVNLKKYGVPFGVSVTATSCNINLLLDDKFYDYYFNELGAVYMWMFQYMPIGRKFTTDLMITPEQRLELFKKVEYNLKEKKYFIADFWNCAMLSNGCVSCGRAGCGYFYVDWNGNMMPCVFVPYYQHNVKDLYAAGKTVEDALFSEFFVKGREWQKKHITERDGSGKLDNLMMPCFIRDHHKEFLETVEGVPIKPEDEAAKQAMASKEYHAALIKYDEKFKKIADAYWEEHYLKEAKVK